MYGWLVFLHVLSASGFLLAHGASAAAALALRRERSFERTQALLSLSASTIGLMYLSLFALLVSGVILGFLGRWWGSGWIWAALLLLAAIIAAMVVLGSRAYTAARKAAGLPYFENNRPQSPLPPASPAELEAILARARPVLLTTIGFGGIAVITWLMVLKPF